MSDPREFSLEEASGLLPRLTLEFGRIARLREQIALAAKALGGPEAAVDLLERKRPPTQGEQRQADQLRELADDVTRTLGRIQELGCVVKDVELGLVDFHAQLEGRRILLCWQFGEGAISHFHGLDEGFANRQPLVVDVEGEGPPTQWVN